MELTINGDLSCMKHLCKDDALEMLSMQLREQIGGVQFEKKVLIYVKYFEKDKKRSEKDVTGDVKFILDTLHELGLIQSVDEKFIHLLQEVYVDREEPRIEVEIKEVHRQMMCDDRYSKKNEELKVPKHCEVCGKVFIPFEIVDNREFRGGDICSFKCLNAWANTMKQKITKHCEFCGKEFQTIVTCKMTCSDNCRKKLSLRNRRCGNE